MVDTAQIIKLSQGIARDFDPDRIILFGSAATGQMTEDSDLDLLVVEPEPANTRDRSVKIRRLNASSVGICASNMSGRLSFLVPKAAILRRWGQ